MSLQGQIEEMGLGATIQALSLNRYRGTLRIESEDAGSQFFFISEGEIVLVRQVQRDPVRLGDLLIRAGKIAESDLQEALARQKTAGKRLGEVLVDMGLVGAEDIDRVIKQKFEEEFLDLFLLDRGRFEFIFGLTPEALFAPEEKLERVTLNTSGLMLEAMRRIDEWQGMIKSLGSLDAIYQVKGASIGPKIADYRFEGIHLPAASRTALFNAVDGNRTLREILALAINDRIATRLETFQYLHALRQNELVKPLEFKNLFGAAKGALEHGDVPGAAKFIRAVLGQKGQLDVALIKRYLGFLKKYKRPRLAFDEARTFAAACLSRDDTENAIALYEEALALEFKSIEVLDRLFYALLRANRRDRAVQVGLGVRDFLASDEALGVAQRISTNLSELAPDDPAVIELAGLILRRQERNEAAAKELERAMAKAPADHPRRASIVAALLELQPERDDLRSEKERLELEAQRRAVALEARRRVLVTVGVFVALILVWRGWQEVQARRAFAAVQELVAKGVDDSETFVKATGLIQDSIRDGLTTVSGPARRLKGEVEAKWAARQHELDVERQRAQEERRAADAQRKKDEQRLQRGLELTSGLADYRRLATQEDYAGASAKALALAKEYADLGDARTADLAVFVQVTSTPPGAEVLRDGEPVGTAPRAVPVPVAQKASIALRLRGHRVAEVQVEGTGYQTKAFTLQPGPSWTLELPDPPLAVAAWPKGLLVADKAGKLASLGWVDGRARWQVDLDGPLRAAAGGKAQALRSLVAQGGKYALLATDDVLAAVALSTGKVEWTRPLPPGEAQPVAAAKVMGQDLLLVTRGAALLAYDVASGTEVKRVPLGAPAAQPPVGGGGKAFVLLKGGQLAAVDLGRAGGLAWAPVKDVPVTAPLLVSELAQAVLVRDVDKVHSYGMADGTLLSTLDPQIGVLVGACPVNERLYALGDRGMLAALRIYDGQLLLRGTRVALKGAAAGPAVVDQEPVMVDAGGDLLLLSPSGVVRSKMQLGGKPTAPLIGAEGRVVAVLGNKVLCIEPPAGE